MRKPWEASPGGDAIPARADEHLKLVLAHVGHGRLDAGLMEVERLLGRHPNFRLAHLVRGDLLLARTRSIAGFGNTGHSGAERLDELRTEALARLRAYNDRPPDGRVPRQLLRLSPSQKHAVVVDASRFRVFVYENANGVPRLVEDFYTTLGRNGIEKLREGDRKTPLGVYHVTSMIRGDKLPDLYGWGALPINYPNEWDRLAGKTGFGIWLHGVPSDTYARAPWASDGCLALANPDIERLAGIVQAGVTPVVIADQVEWLEPSAWQAERDAFLKQLESWRKDWESRDTDRYLSHYARDFRSDGMNRAAWGVHKRRVNAGKAWIKLSLADVSVLRGPGTQDMAVVTFDQDYRSNNLAQRSRKRQYWIVEDGRWKIAYEGLPGRTPTVLPESFPRSKSGA